MEGGPEDRYMVIVGGNGHGRGPENGLVWAGTRLRGILAGEKVKRPLPSPYLAEAMGELGWV